MTVLLFNGSPHKNGCTYTALKEIAETLQNEGIDSQILQIGSTAFRADPAARGGCGPRIMRPIHRE